ncbi:hypothetical protein PVAG01_08823 [Phlyctema vagabunda]|uniref:Uncharacterized protein n=1 Tax=Phlyctema vagabunda TaxID=108571 RepID=A0ABR4PAH5_9HELO
MSTRPDLTLPARAPSIERLHDQPMELRPAALYTLISLSDTELEDLRLACERDTLPTQPGANIRLAPRPRFLGDNLRAVFDYHLQLGTEGVFDPVYFLVAIDRDWENKGVLIVTLDDDDLECKVDKFCSFAPDAGLTIVNLQISNVDWSEAKEEALPLPGGDEDDDDDDNGDNDKDDSKGDNSKEGFAHDDDGPQVPKDPPPAGSFCGVYVIEGADADDVLYNLRPGARMPGATQDPSKWPVSFQGNLSNSGNLVDEAFALHPSRCRRNKWLYKDLFFLADSIDPIENGILLCQLSTRRTQRTPCNALEGLQNIYFGIKNGNLQWSSEKPLFLVYRDSHMKEVPIHLLSKDGGNCILPGNYSAGKRLFFNKLEEAVRWFPFHCRQHRFKSNLKKDYFICIPEDWEKGVLLVHVDWDGNLSRPDDELKALELGENVQSFRCPIDKAYAVLEDIVKSKKPWPTSGDP